MSSLSRLNLKAEIMFFFGVGLLILGAILLLFFFGDDGMENAGFVSAGMGATFTCVGITLKVEADKQKKNYYS